MGRATLDWIHIAIGKEDDIPCCIKVLIAYLFIIVAMIGILRMSVYLGTIPFE
jgi:hypothetical protein